MLVLLFTVIPVFPDFSESFSYPYFVGYRIWIIYVLPLDLCTYALSSN